MLSDESSSDSETGRFKCKTKSPDEKAQISKSIHASKDNLRSLGRKRYENERYREFEARRGERVFNHHAKDRHRNARYSPSQRRNSCERSRQREPSERHRHERNSRDRSKYQRGDSRDRTQRTDSKTQRSPNNRKDIMKSNITETRSEKAGMKLREKRSLSNENKKKRSEVHKPVSFDQPNQKSPVMDEVNIDSDVSEEVKPGSYYSMIPAIVKEKSEESSEIDSSDDEKLRAKLLNLEKEINKTKKKKHKKKHKKKSKSCKDKIQETATFVEVSSTTDIQDKVISNKTSGSETAEVSSTQKSVQKESSEEGEILSDDESQTTIDFDPSDLRHKLKRSIVQANQTKVCGPALPPHLKKRIVQSTSPDKEGPSLPPHLLKARSLGPSIPQDIRKVLEEKSQDIIKFDSSDEDDSVVGPLPVGSEEKWTHAHKCLEERALDIKIKKLDGCSMSKVDIKSREQWMLELPEEKTKYLGLEARTFRAKEGPDMSDRSSWTDTPEEKARKAVLLTRNEDTDVALQREAREKIIAHRDEEQDKAIRKHKKKHKRDESLLEMHQKKLKKKKKKDEKNEEKLERRPFSRDIDLQVNRFDEAQKKSIIKKAQDLDTRFSRGEAKYL